MEDIEDSLCVWCVSKYHQSLTVKRIRNFLFIPIWKWECENVKSDFCDNASQVNCKLTNDLLCNVGIDPFVGAGAVLLDAAALDRRNCHDGRQTDLLGKILNYPNDSSLEFFTVKIGTEISSLVFFLITLYIVYPFLMLSYPQF